MNRVCSICLEVYRYFFSFYFYAWKINARQQQDQILGCYARRMPCQHVFCEDCILTWLDRDNSCPVCKYELPTDSVVYERKRREIVKLYPPRVSEEAISSMKIAELTRLCEYIGVDLSKCIDRSDLESTLKQSGKIKLIEEEKYSTSLKDDVSDEPLSLISRTRWNSDNLSCLRIRDLKLLMQRLGLPLDGCITKSDLTKSLIEAQTKALD